MAQQAKITLEQISAAWQSAQKQLERLRAELARVTHMAERSARASAARDALETAYRDLGEAVWAAVSAGKLKLPNGFSERLRAVERAYAEATRSKDDIQDLLAEGEDAARQRSAPKNPQKPVAVRPKTR
jgi:hypothetical protein